MKKKKILFVINVDWFFLSHRLPIAMEAMNAGYEVILATKDTGLKKEIESYGIKFTEIDFERSGKNPLKELIVICRLLLVFLKVKPDIIHNVTIKPSLYSSILCKLTPFLNHTLINAISGLGYNFIDGRESMTKKVLLVLMKFAFSCKRLTFIFQNVDDLKLYQEFGFVSGNNFRIIKGSGVDEFTCEFHLPVRKQRLVVLFTGRILYDKGIVEFINAAKLLQTRWKDRASFMIAGNIDENNPSSLKEAELNILLVEDYIIWKGFEKNVIPSLVLSDIVCLPSYREGLPKSLIEAMAVGRPIVTTDVPGCRECVEEGINGYLVPSKESDLLANRIEKLLLDESLRLRMGQISREKMIKELSLKIVVGSTLELYKSLA